MSRISVFLVDDHPVFRLGLRALIESFDGIDVVGEAGDGIEAVAAAKSLTIDVVLMDVQMPEISGIEVTRQLLEVRPDLGVLILTMFEDDDSVHAAIRAGARGYLVKGAGADSIERAIRAVAAGEIILGRGAADRASLGWKRGSAAFPELSAREAEVLDMVARGLDNRSIAKRLSVNEKTIRNHLSNILTKIQVTTRSEAIVKARQAGLGEGIE